MYGSSVLPLYEITYLPWSGAEECNSNLFVALAVDSFFFLSFGALTKAIRYPNIQAFVG